MYSIFRVITPKSRLKCPELLYIPIYKAIHRSYPVITIGSSTHIVGNHGRSPILSLESWDGELFKGEKPNP